MLKLRNFEIWVPKSCDLGAQVMWAIMHSNPARWTWSLLQLYQPQGRSNTMERRSALKVPSAVSRKAANRTGQIGPSKGQIGPF